ncbi:DedA family protein [Leucobacter sp. CSA1]|uniref:DedA family protein n=2 Tax=Leucobacter chromiisoli TaxID=2796471 RepID=A0A934Q4D7_9MICO|nr:DedA family protein [Leucobacter chromiisoli]
MDPALRTVVAGLGIMLETSVFVGLVVPGDSIALIAAVGVTSPAQFSWLVVALMAGSLAGESVGFALGRWFGPRLRGSRAGRRLGDRNWALAEHYLGERGGVAVFLSRFLPVLHSLVPLTAGMAGMRYRVFIVWTFAASLVWSLLVVSLGSGAAAGYERLAGTVKGAGLLFAAAAVAAAAALWALKRWFFARERRHMRSEEIEGGDAR